MSQIERHSDAFLAGGGEMGALIRAHDWGATPLGEPRSWSRGLKTAVRLLLSTGHPMFLWWGSELIQFYNDAYRRSIGPERHPSALGQGGRECWDEIWPIIGPQIEQVMAGEGYTWHENQLVPITRYGRREDVYWTYSYGPIDEPEAPHGVGGVLVVCTETTEQVLAEHRLKEAERRWRELFDQAPGFMGILTGSDHRFEFANPALFALLDGRDLFGKVAAEAVPEFETQGFVDLLDNVYRSGEAHAGMATPFAVTQRAGGAGKQLYVDFVYQPIRDPDGNVTGIFVSGHDVTERVMTSRTLREEDRRKDEFLAMLAHELRNPLAPISNAGELLSRTPALDPATRSIGDLLVRQTAQITRLVDDLLDVSRISQNRIELHREPLNLSHAIGLAVEAAQPLLDEKRHRILREESASPVHVDGDLARIVQCIANLLDNAAKYTEPGGRIHVRLTKTNGSAEVDVVDDGSGIDAEMLPKIFELFAQADRSLDRTQGGMGIGLAVVERLIRMHGGNVTAESKGLGHGSTFRISLPLIEAIDTVASEVEAAKTRKRRVLIVDDNADAANSLARLLEVDGHETESVYGARDAFDRHEQFAPEIVLLDIGLPEMDGYEVAERLRAQGSGALLVAVTGYGQAEDVERALEAGFDLHLTKPVAYSELRQILEESAGYPPAPSTAA